jgi:hypothetical protein
MVMALRSKWAVGKAVRAILPIARLDSLLYLLLNRARSGSLIVRVKTPGRRTRRSARFVTKESDNDNDHEDDIREAWKGVFCLEGFDPGGLAVGGRISERYVTDEQRCRRPGGQGQKGSTEMRETGT